MTAMPDLRAAVRPLETWIRLSVRAHAVLPPTEQGVTDRDLVSLVEVIDLLDRAAAGLDEEEPLDEFIGESAESSAIADDQYPVFASYAERRALQKRAKQPLTQSAKFKVSSVEWRLMEQLSACRRAALGQDDSSVLGTSMHTTSAALSEVRQLRAAYDANLRRLYKVQDERDSLARRTVPRVSAVDASATTSPSPGNKWRRLLANGLHQAAKRIAPR